MRSGCGQRIRLELAPHDIQILDREAAVQSIDQPSEVMILGCWIIARPVIAHEIDKQSDVRNACHLARLRERIAFKPDGAAEKLIRSVTISRRKRKTPVGSLSSMDD